MRGELPVRAAWSSGSDGLCRDTGCCWGGGSSGSSGERRGAVSPSGAGFVRHFSNRPGLLGCKVRTLRIFKKDRNLKKQARFKKKGARRSEHTVTVAPLFGQPQRLGVKSRGLGPPPLRRRRRGPDLPERRRPPPRSAAICAAISL